MSKVDIHATSDSCIHHRRSEAGLNIASKNRNSPYNRSIFAFVTGFGYALTTSLVSYISILVESIGPGVMMCPSCPQATSFFISGKSWHKIQAERLICWLIQLSIQCCSHYYTWRGWSLPLKDFTTYSSYQGCFELPGCWYPILVHLMWQVVVITDTNDQTSTNMDDCNRHY